jgi:hypothetical protein
MGLNEMSLYSAETVWRGRYVEYFGYDDNIPDIFDLYADKILFPAGS